ncbi:hypothetical protein Mapa_009640 [Marchantia paleacea]|nr:hypothetical protein Mapa_009640 [Marchantia paleacea]
MEDPVEEISGVLRGLLKRSTFQQMADVLTENFTEDAQFYHPYVNVGPATGLTAIIAVYQYALFFVNYQDVFIHDIVYDAAKNILAVRMTVEVKPWVLLWRTVNLRFFTELQLEDLTEEVTGKRVKKVKVQRDYFIRWPLLQAVPIIGDIYDSDKLRFLIGRITSAFTRTVQGTYQAIVPAKLKNALFEFWRQHLQVPIGEQFHDAEVKIQ